MIRRTIILSFTAFFSLGLLYFVNRYFWPPVLRLPSSEIAREAIINTGMGEIRISLDGRSEFAKSQFTRLCREGFYDQIRFHRIVPGLLIETGDPLTKNPDLKFLWGQGGLGTAFKNQTYRTDRFMDGTMAFSGSGAGTYGSQFFIAVKDTGWLRNRHTILGHVTSGLDVAHRIESAPISSTGLPDDDIIISSVSCP